MATSHGIGVALCLGCVLGGIAEAAVLYQEDFEDGDPNGITVSHGSWSVEMEGGNRFYRANAGGDNTIRTPSMQLDNWAVDLDFRINDPNHGKINLLTNATSTYGLMGHGYSATICPTSGDYFIDILGDPDGNLDVKPYFINAGQWYHIRLERQGSWIRAYIDGASTPHLSGQTQSSIPFEYAAPHFWYGGDVDNIVITPEPAALSLLALGGLAMLRRKR